MILRVVRLERLNDRRDLRGRRVDSLALRHRQRPPVRPYGHIDRDADAIEPGDIRDAGDAEAAQMGLDDGERFVRESRAVRPRAVTLGGLLSEDSFPYHWGCKGIRRTS